MRRVSWSGKTNVSAGVNGPIKEDTATRKRGAVYQNLSVRDIDTKEADQTAREYRSGKPNLCARELSPSEEDIGPRENNAIKFDYSAGEFCSLKANNSTRKHRTVEASAGRVLT